MDDGEGLRLIRDSVDAVAPGKGAQISPETDLVGDGLLDSLDVMSFLFELEQRLGRKLDAITEEYDDYRVSSLLALVVAS